VNGDLDGSAPDFSSQFVYPRCVSGFRWEPIQTSRYGLTNYFAVRGSQIEQHHLGLTRRLATSTVCGVGCRHEAQTELATYFCGTRGIYAQR